LEDHPWVLVYAKVYFYFFNLALILGIHQEPPANSKNKSGQKDTQVQTGYLF